MRLSTEHVVEMSRLARKTAKEAEEFLHDMRPVAEDAGDVDEMIFSVTTTHDLAYRPSRKELWLFRTMLYTLMPICGQNVSVRRLREKGMHRMAVKMSFYYDAAFGF